jgi:hypothetical protein
MLTAQTERENQMKGKSYFMYVQNITEHSHKTYMPMVKIGPSQQTITQYAHEKVLGNVKIGTDCLFHRRQSVV